MRRLAQSVARWIFKILGVNMPLTTTMIETERLMGLNPHGLKARAISRPYPGGCPHKEGSTIILAYERPTTKRPEKYATAKVKSVMPMTFEQRAASNDHTNRMAQGEGFTDAAAWAVYFRGIYGNNPKMMVYRLLLDVVPDQAAGKVEAVSRSPQRSAPQGQSAPAPAPSPPQNVGETKTVGDINSLDDLEDFEKEMFG